MSNIHRPNVYDLIVPCLWPWQLCCWSYAVLLLLVASSSASSSLLLFANVSMIMFNSLSFHTTQITSICRNHWLPRGRKYFFSNSDFNKNKEIA